MKFIAIGRTKGDETTPYSVIGYRAQTVVEFVNEVLSEYPSEWGYFKVKTKDHGFLGSPRIEYRYGELLNEIPDEWQHVEIENIESCGGWSCMDYMIMPKEYVFESQNIKF